MFTGIIEAIKPIQGIRNKEGKLQVTFMKPDTFDDLRLSSSIACNGICLTVIELDKSNFTVEVMHETVLKTTAGSWKNGELINLERALSIGQRLDGHWVQGHVDTAVALLETKTIENTLYLTFALPSEDKGLVVPQGSIAINGTSLTISKLKTDRFTVSLIGHTISNTNLPRLAIGNKVNLEYDVFGKYILRQKETQSMNLEKLYEQGF